MKAFLGEIDHGGLRRFVPEAMIPRDEHGLLAWRRSPCPTTLVWAVLGDQNADAVRAEVGAGRYRRACSVLLNSAAELIPIAVGSPLVAAIHPEVQSS